MSKNDQRRKIDSLSFTRLDEKGGEEGSKGEGGGGRVWGRITLNACPRLQTTLRKSMYHERRSVN